jgi:hypothetical protein
MATQVKNTAQPSGVKCAHCGKSPTILKKCAGCKKVSYCGPECQKNNWSEHKPDCVQDIPKWKLCEVCGKKPCPIKCSSCYATWCCIEHKKKDDVEKVKVEGQQWDLPSHAEYCPNQITVARAATSPMYQQRNVQTLMFKYDGHVFMGFPSSNSGVRLHNLVAPGHQLWELLQGEWNERMPSMRVGSFVDVEDLPRLIFIKQPHENDLMQRMGKPEKR